MTERSATETGVVLSVRVTPRGGRDAILGWDPAAGVLHVRVSAPPLDGAANRAVAALLADRLSLRPRQIVLVGGASARDKRFCLFNLDAAELHHRLAVL